METPIAVFCFNRPQHLQVTLDALRRCEGYSECPLYIYCDAPKKEADIVAAAATQAVAHAWTALYGGTVVVREKNRLYENITDGITELCDRYGCAIVIEDDIVVAPDFLSYMRRGLEQYQNDEKVMIMSGYMLPHVHPQEPATFFLPSAFLWGWATWKRAWKHFEWKPEGIEQFFDDVEQQYRFDYNGRYHFSRMLKRAIEEERAYAWDIQWVFTVFSKQCLALHPSQSLVWNSGFACGQHGSSKMPSFEGRDILWHGNLHISDFELPRMAEGWNFPDEVIVDEKAFQRLSEHFKKIKRRRNWIRIGKKIRSIIT